MTQTFLFAEEMARDEALSRAVHNAGKDWRERAAEVLASMPDDEVTGEDIRLACEAEGVHPHHNNAWGGLVLMFIRDELLEPTGRYVPMKAKGSHARKTQVYRKVRA